MEEIPNSALKDNMLPERSSNWPEISSFAHTFNGYEHWGSFEKCGNIANIILEEYKTSGKLPAKLTDLRTCLFFETRRWRHYGYEPDEEALRYVQALVEAIRVCVRSERFE